MKCFRCKQENPAHTKYCGECGVRLQLQSQLINAFSFVCMYSSRTRSSGFFAPLWSGSPSSAGGSHHLYTSAGDTFSAAATAFTPGSSTALRMTS